MEWLFVIFVAVAIVTFIGHGIWVLLATIFRALFAGVQEPKVRCRHCGHNAIAARGRCDWCGQSLFSAPADEQADLTAVSRQLQRWQSRGAIKPCTVDRLLARVEAYRKSLSAPPPRLEKPATAEPLLAEVVEPARPTAPVAQPPHPRRAIPTLAPQIFKAPAAATAAPAAPVARPRRSLAEVLSTFMEERNIRWGELVGGLLIVGSSIALVISIWEQLKAIPYFQFFIFVAVSAAMFGLGLYTEHRWKLASTSRGVLIIATLLVPLNFVAMVATRRPEFDPRALVTELAALAIFVALVQRAGRILVERWAWWLTAAVVGCSGVILLLLGHPAPGWALCVGAIAAAFQTISIAAALVSVRRDENLSPALVTRLFSLTGVVSFALAVALSMAAIRSADRLLAMHALAPLLALAAIPIVLCGLLVMKGLSSTSEQAGLRTAGTAVALIGATIMLVALALAWPMPLSLVAVGLFNFASLAIIAIRHQLRSLHAVAVACLAVGYVAACHLAAGHLPPADASDAMVLARLFVDGQTGLWLVGIVLLLVVLAEALAWKKRFADAAYYVSAAPVVAVVSLSLVTWPVFAYGGDFSLRAAVGYAVFGICGLIVNLRLRHPVIGYVATLLMYAAALFGATAWLVEQSWVDHDPVQLLARQSLQAYAAAWAVLSVLCVMARVGVRWRAASHLPQTLGLDRWLLRLTIVASLLLAIWQVAPGVALEYAGRPALAATVPSTAIGWTLLAAAACALFAALWDGWRDDDVAEATLLTVNAVLLAAIPASAAWATASALRWGLAIVFVASAGIMWFRENIARGGLSLGCQLNTSSAAPRIARAVWVVTAAAPVVVCSMLAAVMQIAGHPPAGPLTGTWFANLGMEISHLVPLALVVVGLTVYAVREASPGYAFSAGLVANLTAVGGYALVVPRFGAVEAARLVQLATIVPAVWAIGWLATRRFVLARASRDALPSSRSLLRLQVMQSALGSLLLILSASAALFLDSPTLGTPFHNWVAAVGSPLGWLALIVAAGAGAYRIRQFGERFRPDLVGLVGMAALTLAACGVEAAVPQTPWSYRALMLGWAMYALSVVAATWYASTVFAPTGAEGPPQTFVRAAALWVRLAGLLAVALGAKIVLVAGIANVETLWSAAAIGIASAACATMAVWLRREGWAFTAGLGVNLAASLAVCHQFAVNQRPLSDEWALLWQVNVIAGAVVAILWLAARRRMYLGRQLSPLASPLLTLQVGLIAAGSIGLLAVPGGLIVSLSSGASSLAVRFTTAAGWFAWLTTSGAMAGYVYHAARRAVVDVFAMFLLGVGILLATMRLPLDAAAAYQTLVITWLAAGFVLLVGGWVTHRLPSSVERAAVGDWLRSLAPKRRLETWIAAIPLLAAAVAVRGTFHDAPWGASLGLTLFAGAVLPGALAVWLRRPQHLYGSGLLVNLAASLVWYAQPHPLWADLVLANALAAAATAMFWSIWSIIVGPIEERDRPDVLPPLEHTAAVVATGLLTVAGGWSWIWAWLGRPFAASDWLIWSALIASVVAFLVSLWDKRTALGWPGLYFGGLAAIAFALVAYGWLGDELAWATTIALPSGVCGAAAAAFIGIPTSLRARLRLPTANGALDWFSTTQACIGIVATALGLWSALYFDSPTDRLAGAISAGLLWAATVLMLRRADRFWPTMWRVSSLVLLALVSAELGWAWASGGDRMLLWIHREAILLASFAMLIAVCEFIASRWTTSPLASPKDVLSRSESRLWPTSIARFLPLAIGLLLVLLGVVFLQEINYRATLEHAPDGTRPGVPMAPVAKLTVLAVLVEMIVLALRYAIAGQRDPLRLLMRGRTAYVYAAELLALAICLHIRVTMPKLLPFGIIENWWTLVVMIVAFCGAGLSEVFRRRKLEVLSEPLTRTALMAPLLPVLALVLYVVWRPTDVAAWVFRARLVDDEAVFFLVAIFYGLQGWLRRSITFWGFSALAANAGFWLLWHRLHLEFLVHPQLWLIPPAMAVLVAEYLNHDRLSRQQSDAVRYLALSVIYVSSTADVFISHVGRDISLPLILVLMGLSVVGILSGMLLQVRSFLYLGFSFLLVDLSIMVYHAAWDLGHTWVFWATGIAVGAAIIALFAVFEKRRNEAAKQVGGK